MFQIYNKSLSGQFYNVTIQCTVQSRGNPEEPLIGLSVVRDPLWSARVIAAPCDNNPSPLYCEVFSCTDLLSEPRYPAPSVIYCSRSCTLFFVVLIYRTITIVGWNNRLWTSYFTQFNETVMLPILNIFYHYSVYTNCMIMQHLSKIPLRKFPNIIIYKHQNW